MNTYKLFTLMFPGTPPRHVMRNDGAAIPFDLDNTDCAKFLSDWQSGAEVLDPEGNPLPYSPEAATALGL